MWLPNKEKQMNTQQLFTLKLVALVMASIALGTATLNYSMEKSYEKKYIQTTTEFAAANDKLTGQMLVRLEKRMEMVLLRREIDALNNKMGKPAMYTERDKSAPTLASLKDD
jgi:maltodextrin utilization protein YvdJ